MRKAIKFSVLSLMLATVLPLAGAAGPAKAKPVKCPACHMIASTKRTKEATVAMRLKPGGKIYYCCNKCHMPASILVKKKMSPMKVAAKPVGK